MSTTVRVFVLILLAAAIGCSSVDNRLVPDVTEEEERHAVVTIEEYAVYERVLREQGGAPFIVVAHRPTSHLGELGPDRLLKKIIPELASDTLEHFIWNNRDAVRPISLEFKDELAVIDYSEVEPDSGPYSIFSRVGFSSDGQQALVYYHYSCDALCSRGAYYLLYRVGDRWEIKHESETFRS